MFSLLKNIIAVVGLLVLAGIGYYLYTLNTSSTLDTSSSVPVRQAEIENETFLRRLSELQTMRLSGDMFTDPVFDSFVDFGRPIVPSSVGRDNPFNQ